MGVGAGLSMYVVVVQKFTFAISSPDEFLLNMEPSEYVIDLGFMAESEEWFLMALAAVDE